MAGIEPADSLERTAMLKFKPYTVEIPELALATMVDGIRFLVQETDGSHPANIEVTDPDNLIAAIVSLGRGNVEVIARHTDTHGREWESRLTPTPGNTWSAWIDTSAEARVSRMVTEAREILDAIDYKSLPNAITSVNKITRIRTRLNMLGDSGRKAALEIAEEVKNVKEKVRIEAR